MAKEILPAIIIHGGGGLAVNHNNASQEKSFIEKKEAMRRFAKEGFEALMSGVPALEVVVFTVQKLENHPLFNAGFGGDLSENGKVVLDASIMDGKTMQFAGLIGVTAVQNPIVVVHELLGEPHFLLQGEGADNRAREIAKRLGLPHDVDLRTQLKIKEYQKWRDKKGKMKAVAKKGGSTVGVAIVDLDGRTAAGTSTAGFTGKPLGRVGDSGLLGAGTYADKYAAASATGEGEKVIAMGSTKSGVLFMAKTMSHPSFAARREIRQLERKTGGHAGLIFVDHTGRIGASTNMEEMPIAYQNGIMINPAVVVKVSHK